MKSVIGDGTENAAGVIGQPLDGWVPGDHCLAFFAAEQDLQVNAGHGINYRNIALIHKIPHLTELNIGHSIVSRAVVVGIENAVKALLGAMADYKA